MTVIPAALAASFAGAGIEQDLVAMRARAARAHPELFAP